ncbi:MAG: flavodoxin [Phycisphaerae bacterium]|nr:flavodoxin [Phycisphaerae bacterium]
MRTLLVYYSRTGVTRTVAQALAERFRADVEELHDRKARTGPWGWITACMDAACKRSTEIDLPAKDPAAYDLVLIGTPVWAYTMAPALRTYLSQRGRAIKRAVLFCTMGSSGDRRTFRHMVQLIGKPPTAVLALLERDVRSGIFAASVRDLADQLGMGG